MHFATKLFVVLLVVFSIANAAVQIAFVTTTYNWKDVAEKRQAAVEVAQANMVNAQDNALLRVLRLESLLAQVQQERAAVNAQLLAQRNEAQGLRNEIAALGGQVATLTATANTLGSEVDAGNKERRQQAEILADAQKQGINLQRINLDLSTRLKDLEGQILRTNQKARTFEQRVADLTEENKRLLDRLAIAQQGRLAPTTGEIPGDTARPLAPAAAAQIKGTITDVKGKLAQISVGEADGVQAGMKFSIYRGSKYLGELEIGAVEAEGAAGTILHSLEPVTPQDRVIHGL